MRKICLLAVTMTLAAPALAETPVQNRIDFQTEVESVVTNDLLTAGLSIESNNKNPAALSRELTVKINEALRQASAFKTVKLTSGNQQTWPVYSDKNKLESWRGRAELRLESQDFKAAGELISLLQANLQLNGLHFSVAPATRRELENQLIEQAVQAFRQRADRIRTAWNAKSYKLVQMNLGTANQPSPPPVCTGMVLTVCHWFSSGSTPGAHWILPSNVVPARALMTPLMGTSVVRRCG